MTFDSFETADRDVPGTKPNGRNMNTLQRASYFALLAILSTGVTSAWGQPIVQTFETSGDLANGMYRLTVDPFDSMNGTRALSSVGLEFDGFVDMEVLITNYTSLDLQTDEWFYDAGANMLLTFDSKPGFDDGGPFYGLGGVFETGITGELSAGSGGPPPPFGNPTPGDVTVTESLSNDFSAFVESNSMLSYFEAEEPLQATISPFQDFIVSMPAAEPDGFIDIEATSLEFNGTLEITYNWVETTGRPEDCNADGLVDFQDLACVCGESFASVDDVLNAANLIKGDTDGDGDVAFADFLNLSANFGNEGTYLDGDLDCDGNVTFSDFLILSANFGQTTNETLHSVPEPSSGTLTLMIALAGSLILRFHRVASARS